MNLTTEKNGEELIVHLSGELNTVTAPELKELLDENLSGVKNGSRTCSILNASSR